MEELDDERGNKKRDTGAGLKSNCSVDSLGNVACCGFNLDEDEENTEEMLLFSIDQNSLCQALGAVALRQKWNSIHLLHKFPFL